MNFKSKKAGRPVSEAAFARAAQNLECDIAAIKAVAEVESRGTGFLADSRPKILFERHKFREFTKGRYNDSDPDISGPPGNYQGGAKEYIRLEKAMALDPEAALMSTSWGKFQIMGFNHKVCGFTEVEGFVKAMVESADRHLEAFVRFVAGSRMDRYLRDRDWAGFAKRYNGPGFRKHNYHLKIAQTYARYAEKPLPAIPPTEPTPEMPPDFKIESVRDLQIALDTLGMPPGPIDNRMGPKTRSAIQAFQRFVNLPETGQFDDCIRAAVQAAYYTIKRFKALDGPGAGR